MDLKSASKKLTAIVVALLLAGLVFLAVFHIFQLLSPYGLALSDRDYDSRTPENCASRYGSYCGFKVIGFSNIRVTGYTCAEVYLGYITNMGEYPITLKSIDWVNDGCAKSFDTYLAPGDAIDLDEVGGCSGQTPSELKVTYLRMMDNVTVEETAQIPKYTGSQFDTDIDYPGKTICVMT